MITFNNNKVTVLILFVLFIHFWAAKVLAQQDDKFVSEEVYFLNGETKLSGTLSKPSNEDKYPAIVLLSGSGPQNRDGSSEYIPDYKPFAGISDYLTQKGFAVLSYDDRGVGNSTGIYIDAVEEDFFEDAEAAVNFLSARIDIQAVGLIGHSEGALIAANVAAKNPDIAFIISLGGGAVDGYTLLLSQAERQAETLGMTSDQVAAMVEEQKILFDLVLEKNWEELIKQVASVTKKRLESLPVEKTANINIDEYALKRANQSVVAFQHPRYQYLLGHDFGTDWEKLSIPILAIFGELDVHCDASINKSAMETIDKLNGIHNITVVEIPEANHLFIKAKTGSMSEYQALSKDLVPGLLETISDWLLSIKYNIHINDFSHLE